MQLTGFDAPAFSQDKLNIQPQQQKSNEEEKKKKKKGWLSSLISEASSLGGGALGGAIGTAVMPGVGTLIGSGLGTLIGGTAGSVGEQKFRDDEVSYSKALGEGALDALLAGRPIKAAKGVKAAAGAVKSGSVGDALEAANKAIEAPGLLSKVGKNLRGDARGISVGEKLSGDRIGPKNVDELNSFLEKEVKVKGNNASKQLESLEAYIKNTSDELTSSIDKFNRPLIKKEKNEIVNNFGQGFKDRIVGASKRQQDIAADLVVRVKQAKDIKSLDNLRKIVDENINFARNASSPEPAAEQVYKMFRKELTDAVANKVGGAKGLKSNLSKAFSSEELLLNKAVKPSNGLSPFGVTPPGKISQAVQTASGKVLGSAGGALDDMGVKGLTSRIVPTSGIQAAATPPDPSVQAEDMGIEIPQEMPEEDPNVGREFTVKDGQLVEVPGSENMDTDLRSKLTEQMLSALASGDYKGIAAIKSVIDSLPKENSSKLSADAKKNSAKAAGATAIIDKLEQRHAAAGGGKGRISGLLSKVKGKAGLDDATAVYEDQRQAYLSTIIRSFGEVGTLTDQDIARISGAIPSVTANPSEAKAKFSDLRSLLGEIQSRSTAAQSDDFNLEELLGAQ